ncbi:MAG: DsrE family protein [Gammaproteobacteria bacterium]|nr:DsrE family protein [Gammaproteobacteria bacterium]
MSRVLVCVIASLWTVAPLADQDTPWGRASLQAIDYAPQKVVYDVAVADVESFSRVLDRVSYLHNLYHADPFDESIVLVLHGDEIPFFAVDNFGRYRELMRRAQSLTVGGIVQIRMCRVAAAGHGLEPDDIQGFVKVVPMADAEIVRLQQEEGYAYMR